AKAIRIHDYVRDEIAFGWTDSFYRMSAIDVLKAKVGYCNTKGTLFIALLRAAGIPARQRFVAIPSDVLSGLVDPGTPKVDHSYSEVWLDDRWVRVDSYIVDRPLFIQAQKALAASGRSVGFGIRLGGLTDWNGIDDSFLQFARDDNDTDTEHYGVFLDVEDYYQQVDGWNELSGLRSLLIPLFIGQATSQVESLRVGTRSDSSD
ncbi:MAG: transglutaminase-like domain-containing protein, partial [Pseudomonadota bacterium]